MSHYPHILKLTTGKVQNIHLYLRLSNHGLVLTPFSTSYYTTMISYAIILVVACDPSTRAVPLLGGLPRQFARRSEESTSSKTILAALLFIPQLLTLSSRVPDRGAKWVFDLAQGSPTG
ncbi:hypothetical protein PoB_002108700 [Plakobranchus ocellatus]|uniref:Uncharacterized protein n=2 Tax=Plakobranchus ocellatus TaxID=259542 RepID=A0AAV3ZJ72_9GAST|nr:hypothetical protein PoB_002108700 [Plakobranchus ocellatus]